jgi:hypothetical protein
MTANRIHLCALVAVGVFAAASLGAQQPANAGRKVTIPEGTPVKVHIYGRNEVNCYAYKKDKPPTSRKDPRLPIQVDDPVVVDGAVVIPLGSLGLMMIDGGYDKKNVEYKFGAGLHTETVHYCYVHLVSVMAIDESDVPLDGARIDLAPPLPGIPTKNYNTAFTGNLQLTGKMKQAVVVVP